MKNGIATRLCRWYYRNVMDNYSHVRGVVRLGGFLTEVAVRSETVPGDRAYTLEVGGVSIKASEREHLQELVQRNPVRGYTLKRDIQEGDTVLDAGAYPGEFTVYAAEKCGGGKVIAMEPDPENASALRENIRINGLDNVEIIEKGLWLREGTVGFEDGEKGASSVETGSSDEIPVTTLDAIHEEYGSLDFVKMDVEGSEVSALRGGGKALEEGRPFFAIASYHVVNGEPTHHILEKILREKGFRATTEYPSHQTTFGIPTQPD